MPIKQVPKLQRERASDAVYQILRDSILTQVFQPGERLNVLELTEKLDVSQTPLKEAINRLAVEGLIEIHPRSGTYVTDISPTVLAETFEIRTALECLAAEKAIEKITPEIVKRFRQLVDDLDRPLNTEKERALHELKNSEFHGLLVELSGNRKLVEMYASLHAHIKIARVHYSRQGWANRQAEEKKEHRRILKALESGDLVGLVTTLRQHIGRAADALISDVSKASEKQVPGEKS
jgi:DNA-binding GntR family transcriptional regulator